MATGAEIKAALHTLNETAVTINGVTFTLVEPTLPRFMALLDSSQSLEDENVTKKWAAAALEHIRDENDSNVFADAAEAEAFASGLAFETTTTLATKLREVAGLEIVTP